MNSISVMRAPEGARSVAFDLLGHSVKRASGLSRFAMLALAGTALSFPTTALADPPSPEVLVGSYIKIGLNAFGTLGSDGTITARTAGQPPATLGRLKLATPGADDPLKRGDDGLFRATSGNPIPNDANARMLAGAVEGSNVNAVETMVGMIAASRQFEQQMRLLQTAETNDKTASQLLSMNG